MMSLAAEHADIIAIAAQGHKDQIGERIEYVKTLAGSRLSTSSRRRFHAAVEVTVLLRVRGPVHERRVCSVQYATVGDEPQWCPMVPVYQRLRMHSACCVR
jgi:hypothetical protein